MGIHIRPRIHFDGMEEDVAAKSAGRNIKENGKGRGQKGLSEAQILLAYHLQELGVHVVFEYQFLPDRKYRFDLLDDENKIGYEADGGEFSGGHMRGKKLEDQYEKDRLAQLHGYRIFRFTNRQILNGEAKKWLQEHLYPF